MKQSTKERLKANEFWISLALLLGVMELVHLIVPGLSSWQLGLAALVAFFASSKLWRAVWKRWGIADGDVAPSKLSKGLSRGLRALVAVILMWAVIRIVMSVAEAHPPTI
ncbi:hypothetical protein [Candidatus Poriferisocius sp.]|uniref:hypothetical protein n=1 Tax=Candidatus Poriferisocius sp. TaxID=3101276 RepID=UPI003B02240C